ncbi:MAG: prolipoprotein diacylglyceryl transferase [Anaerolineales bacterium]
MINPIMFTIHIGSFSWPVRWYGVILMTATVIAAWLAEREVRRRGENGDHIWNAAIWLIPAGVIGARLWFVVNATLGGNLLYLDQPLQILNIPAGGLHIYGGLLFGGIALFLYARRYELDLWLLLDSIAPTILIGQALARPANFINQELYGQPTTLPWGISISADHRLTAYSDLSVYPVATTRFHPTFAYEMIWNFLAAALLFWLLYRFGSRIKPGGMFAGWLICAGVGRSIIEQFRPDQPRIPGLALTYTNLVSLLMALVGVLFLLWRYEVIHLSFLPDLSDAYKISTKKIS